MKKNLIFFYIITALVTLNCTGSNKKKEDNSSAALSNGSKAQIMFKEYEHDFGKVAEGEKIAYVFTFENKGNSNLVIKSALTTCGCTVPKYNTKPIPPGEGGNVEVVFDTSGRSGMQTKTITVRSNASIPSVILKITAEVTDNIN